MTIRTSKEEKVAKVNGKYILFSAIIAGLFSLIALYINRDKKEPTEIKKEISVAKDTSKPLPPTKNNISNNTINQQNSKNSNAQIGTDNSK